MLERRSPMELLLAVAPHVAKVAPIRAAFVGGATTHLHVTDPFALMPRSTEDVDIIVDVTSRAEYQTMFRDKLRALGAREDTSEGAPTCRWIINGVVVDFMPSDADVLGFSNRWYDAALESATSRALPEGTTIQVVSSAYFIATKIEAFNGRGRGDFLSSKDIEDLIAVVYGRPELVDEVEAAPRDVRDFIRVVFREWLALETFEDAIRANLPGDSAQDERAQLVKERFEQIAAIR